MVEEINSDVVSDDSSDDSFQDEQLDVLYTCLRCNTTVSVSELSRLPEIKCICGFRVFTKVRRPVVKSVKAV
jgi:DNA-directed RNA polymerase subunit P